MIILLGAVESHAQWVMVARAVRGRIERMTNKSKQGSGYDVATVVLEAKAAKVYQTALQVLGERSDLVITSKNADKRQVNFSKGDQIASLQVTPLSDDLSQLTVASSLDGDAGGDTSTVVQGILKVCTKLHVVCAESQK